MHKVITPWPETWLRTELEAELQWRLTDRQWEYLRERTDVIRDAQAGKMDLSASAFKSKGPFGSGSLVDFRKLADHARRALQDFGATPPRPIRPPEVVIPRARAHMDSLSRILAIRIARRDDVRRIRGRRLRTKREIEEATQLAARLAAETGWTPDEAIAFLTGREIRLLPMNTQARGGRYITLSIDPIVSPQELGRAYSEIRRAVAGAGRVRRLTPKHLELAVFMAERPEGEKPRWEDRRKAWNGRAPKKWRYPASQLTNFARDCMQAQRRMEESR